MSETISARFRLYLATPADMEEFATDEKFFKSCHPECMNRGTGRSFTGFPLKTSGNDGLWYGIRSEGQTVESDRTRRNG